MVNAIFRPIRVVERFLFPIADRCHVPYCMSAPTVLADVPWDGDNGETGFTRLPFCSACAELTTWIERDRKSTRLLSARSRT